MSEALFKKHFQELEKLNRSPQVKKSVVRRLLPYQKVLIVSPHPDDEILQSALAIRLQQENGLQVINAAVTLGSDKSQRARRLKELNGALKFLKFKSYILPESWGQKKNELIKIIKNEKPALIIAPHALDQHLTHQRTSTLVKESTSGFRGHIAWSEFWSPQQNPNLMIEVPLRIYVKQYKALEFHKGEIERNPYHLRLQSWLIDNVRRGSEIIQRPGSTSLCMTMGQIYHFKKNHKASESFHPFAFSHDDLSDWLQ